MSVNKFIDSKSLSIVILGNFNPTIFQPFWLAHKELIKASEAEKTTVQLIHNELVNFDLGWAKVDVRPTRFEVSSTSEPYFSLVRDLVIGIFYYLRETPVTALGINHYYNLSLQTTERFYEFGNKLTPLNNWSFLNDARLTKFEILEKDRKDNIPGHYRIKVDSDESRSFGVNIVMNNHFTASPDLNKKSNEVVRIIEEYWKTAAETADKNLENIWATLNLN